MKQRKGIKSMCTVMGVEKWTELLNHHTVHPRLT